MAYSTKREALEAYGFIVGGRNPLINTDFPGQFMVVEAHETSELPTRDGRNGPWCIVGDDLNALIDRAYSIWAPEFVERTEGQMETFSVCQFFSDRTNEYIRRNVSDLEAMKAFQTYTNNPASKLGIVDRVIITDSGDSIVFEWEFGKGITFGLGVGDG